MKRARSIFIPGIALWLLTLGFSYGQDMCVHPGRVDTHIGEPFAVDIMAQNVASLSTFEFRMSFDRDILEATGVVRGSLWGDPGYLWHAGEIDNTSGIIGFVSGAAYSGSSPVGVSADASGDVLATVTFQAISAGISPVDLTDVLMYSVNGHEISVNIANAQIIVAIQSSPPVAEASGPYSGEEGSLIAFEGSGSSDPNGAIVSYEWDFGDGTTSAGVTASHMYADNGTYTVTLAVTDNSGSTGTDTATVTVENVAPTGVNAGPDQAINEGDTVSFSGSFTDPGSGDTHMIKWIFGYGSSAASGTLTPTYLYADNGAYTVALTVADDDGGVGTDTTLVTVNNVAPNAEAGAPYSGMAGEPVTFTGSGTDPGADTLTYSWDFGDGSPPEMGQTASHTYSAPGTYTATLTVTDDDGGEGADTAEATINSSDLAAYVNIDISVKNSRVWWEAKATVTIRDKDAYGPPIGAAEVHGHWSGIHNGSVSGKTKRDGEVDFKTGRIRTGGIVMLTVDRVLKSGQEYILPAGASCSMSNCPGAEHGFALAQNYPNPSNPDTWIPFTIGQDCEVTIRIYDVIGKLVRTLDLGYLDAGVYMDKRKSAYWDGKNENGDGVSSSVYFCIMEAGEYKAARKMLIVK